MLMLWNFTVLILSFIKVTDGSDFGNIKLKVCMLKEEGMRESLPLIHENVKAVELWHGYVAQEKISIDFCASKHMIKMSLLLHTGLKGNITLCMEQFRGPDSESHCFNLSVLNTVKSNSSITCWFQQNVTGPTIVRFYMKTHFDSKGRPKDYTYSGGNMFGNRGLCENACEKVEPFYADRFHCGGKAKMRIPRIAAVRQVEMACAFCEDRSYEKLVSHTDENDPSNVMIEFDGNLQDEKYNISVYLDIKDDFGEYKLCRYDKTVRIYCIGGSTKIPSTKEANKANIGQSKDSNDRTCDTNFSHCSFLDFVLFGGSVSAVTILIICFGAFISVKRKKVAQILRSACQENTETVSSGGEQIPMFLNNHSGRDSPASTHFPKHAHFHKTDEQYRLLFLPRPFDSFTRDCMDSLSKILSLDGRILSSCVFDKSIQNEIFANKFQWKDKILGDRHNIVIFLCFTSPSVKHEQSIVDEVMTRCQPPATPPTCRTFFAHMTDSAEYLDEITFSGRRFNLVNVTEFEHFLEAVFIFYGYKADNEHDRHEFKQILHCGLSNHFMKKLRTPC